MRHLQHAVAQRTESLRRAAVIFYLRFRDGHQRARVCRVEDRPLLVLEGVFSPDSFTTRLVLGQRHRLAGRKVLDMGCGAGALEVLTAGRVSSITASDVSEQAVRNTVLNLSWHQVVGVAVVHSDLFASLQGQFDTIVFNAPFFPGTPRTEADRKWLGGDGQLLRRFLAEAPAHLSPGGEIWLTHSSIANESAFLRILADTGLQWTVLASLNIWIETFKLYRLKAGPDARGGRHV